MRPPLDLLGRPTFVAASAADICAALGNAVADNEIAEIIRLSDLGLPPVTSIEALSVMTGYNPSFVWLLTNRASRFYRIFQIPKGRTFRQIEAPRVALKFVQKWLSLNLSKGWRTTDEVHGFVQGRSHLTAAAAHLGAKWVITLDLKNFFPSISSNMIKSCLQNVGYTQNEGLDILVKLMSFEGRLSQGAPTSPIISNIALSGIDRALGDIAKMRNLRFTRYVDDITFSGITSADDPEFILEEIKGVFTGTPWTVSDKKIQISKLPSRLKVHGLLVHGEKLRLTKGYRNRIRAYRHLVAQGKIASNDRRRVAGHLNYATQVESKI